MSWGSGTHAERSKAARDYYGSNAFPVSKPKFDIAREVHVARSYVRDIKDRYLLGNNADDKHTACLSDIG